MWVAILCQFEDESVHCVSGMQVSPTTYSPLPRIYHRAILRLTVLPYLFTRIYLGESYSEIRHV